MRGAESGCAAIIAAAGLFCSSFCRLRGDEPVKPTASASEANPAVPAPGHSVHGEAFNDGPRHAAHLMPGMGKVHFPVTTAKPEAQAFVDQGVAQLHSFYYFESERSFRQAAKIDPGCAMAYWGMAMSNVNNPKRAKGSSRKPGNGPPGSARANRSIWTHSSRFTRRAPTPSAAAGLASGSRDPSSRISRATSTPVPGWRW